MDKNMENPLKHTLKLFEDFGDRTIEIKMTVTPEELIEIAAFIQKLRTTTRQNS